jgi:hypothetical protein
VRSLIAALVVVAQACAHAPRVTVSGTEVEMALDEGRAAQRPLTPGKTFEMLIRIDPRMPAYRLERMRFLLAQPGHLVFSVYAINAEGRPGDLLKTIDRVYGPELISTANDGKWVTESLVDVPVQRAPIFIGIYSPEKEGDPRLWASSNDSGHVFQREADPSTPLSSSRIPRTPKLRVVLVPHG